MDNLTVVVPFFNGGRWIGRLLDSLPPGLPVIIVDDQSDERLTLNRPHVTVYRPPIKRYFTGAVNFGIEQCSTDVLVLNQDAWLEGTAWLDLIADNRGEYALIGERIRGNHPAFPNGYVQGTFQYMRRDAIEAAGLMDETHYPLWGASALWQWQITRKGFKSLPVLPVPGFHHAEDRKEPHGDSIMELLKRFPDRKPQLIRTPPAISVVVPAFNHGRFLPDLLHSLIGGPTSIGQHPGQTFQSFEVIVVDDGSTDNTAEVMQDYADGWRGIRYIRQDNAGTGAANNAGVKAALGKYITITGADDMREAWSLADLYEAAEAHPHSFVYDEPIILSQWGNQARRNGKYKLDPYDFEMLLLKNMVPAGIMYPKQAWVEAGGYPTRGLIRRGREDWAFNIALGIKGWCGVKIDRPGYLYRRHENNRTNTNTDTEWLQRFLVQMAALFPAVYGGDRPMGCCGGGRRAPAATTQKAMSAMSRAGASMQGMTLIEYVGKNKGSSQWGGPGGSPSRQKYIFGDNGRDKIKYVKADDVAWILGLRDEGQTLFRVYAPKPVDPEIESDSQPEPTDDELSLHGVSFADFRKAVEALGLSKKDAEESFRSLLNGWANPSEKSAQAMRELGIQPITEDFSGLSELQSRLFLALEKLSLEERAESLMEMFGVSAYRSLVAMMDLLSGDLTEGEKANRDAIPVTLIADDEGDILIVDPNQLTIPEIKQLDQDERQWRAIYEAEKNGKNRAGALEFISSKLPADDAA